jgi:hypothetical protein
VERWRDAGGTLSVVGLGKETDRDGDLLKDIARRGDGRVYFTADARQLPRIFAQDVMFVARKTFLEQRTAVIPARGLIALEMGAEEIPDIDGYNLCFLSPGAELMLVSGDDNRAPLAAGWQRGTGKVVAVTLEADGPYTGAFAGWSRYKELFRRSLEWIKKGEQTGEVSADLSLAGRQATVSVEIDPLLRLPSMPAADIIAPDEREPQKVDLGWTGPTTLQGSFTIESDGAYHGVVSVPGQRPVFLPPVILPYSPEFAPRRGDAGGEELLQRLARSTGGGPFAHVDDFREATLSRSTVQGTISLARWLVLALLLLMLYEIAHRRGLLDLAYAAAGDGGRRVGRAARAAGQKIRPRRSRVPGTEPDEEVAVPAADGAVDQDAGRPADRPADRSAATDQGPAPKTDGARSGSDDAFRLAKKRARHR